MSFLSSPSLQMLISPADFLTCLARLMKPVASQLKTGSESTTICMCFQLQCGFLKVVISLGSKFLKKSIQLVGRGFFKASQGLSSEVFHQSCHSHRLFPMLILSFLYFSVFSPVTVLHTACPHHPHNSHWELTAWPPGWWKVALSPSPTLSQCPGEGLRDRQILSSDSPCRSMCHPLPHVSCEQSPAFFWLELPWRNSSKCIPRVLGGRKLAPPNPPDFCFPAMVNRWTQLWLPFGM